jgi:hypothetical protein
MKKLLFYAAFLTSAGVINAQQTITMNPKEDCSIGFHDNYNSANNNYGFAIYYGAFSQPGTSGGENAGMGLMKFDLSQIPAGTVISSATLDLYGSGPFGTGDVAEIGHTGNNASYLERVTSNWSENIVTYNTQPTATYKHRVKLKESISADQDYLGVNVTKLVQDMVNDPSNSYGFRIRLRSEEPYRAMSFVSTDGAETSKFPVLTITYGAEKLTSAESKLHSITVYPNPTADFFNINLNGYALKGDLTIQIVNMQGMLMRSMSNLSNELIQIQRDGLPAGIYMLRLFDEGKVFATSSLIFE